MIVLREKFENREKNFMAPFGCLSSKSRGRQKNEDGCPIRTVFQVDKDRIVYSNSFRRLKYKTQVFLSPLGDHYRTRLTHTLEVAQISRNIARAFRINEDLAEAIALGHDLGHTPFGHSGEAALKEIYSSHFTHNKQSLRVVDQLEAQGSGLNLTYEVRDGILKHSKGYGDIITDDPDKMSVTVEGQIVRIADIMAYLNHDLDDAIRSGVIENDQVPQLCTETIGRSHSERALTMIRDLIYNSKINGEYPELKMSRNMHKAMICAREFLYNNVYRSYQVHKEFVKAKKIITELYHFFLDENNYDFLIKELNEIEISNCHSETESIERIVCDFIASMTDRYALKLYTKIFFPSPFV